MFLDRNLREKVYSKNTLICRKSYFLSLVKKRRSDYPCVKVLII